VGDGGRPSVGFWGITRRCFFHVGVGLAWDPVQFPFSIVALIFQSGGGGGFFRSGKLLLGPGVGEISVSKGGGGNKPSGIWVFLPKKIVGPGGISWGGVELAFVKSGFSGLGSFFFFHTYPFVCFSGCVLGGTRRLLRGLGTSGG